MADRWVTKTSGVICYLNPPIINKEILIEKRTNILKNGEEILKLEVPAKSGLSWEIKTGNICRISVHKGSQVGDLNLWNLNNYQEHFFSGKTRQLHSSHITIGDRLWSNYVRPMASIVADTLNGYGIDPDGAGVHDVIGTRCDPYTKQLLGIEPGKTCHGNLMDAVKSRNIPEYLIHDVWNIFMCTGFNKNGKYFVKPSPAKNGDYIEILAEMDLLLALSACPQGDVSQPVGEIVPDSSCHPLLVQVFREK